MRKRLWKRGEKGTSTVTMRDGNSNSNGNGNDNSCYSREVIPQHIQHSYTYTEEFTPIWEKGGKGSQQRVTVDCTAISRRPNKGRSTIHLSMMANKLKKCHSGRPQKTNQAGLQMLGAECDVQQIEKETRGWAKERERKKETFPWDFLSFTIYV